MAMRNHQCRHYPDCLTRAARAGTTFDCTSCERYQGGPFNFSDTDLVGSLCLLLAILEPNAYREQHLTPGFRYRLLKAFLASLNRGRYQVVYPREDR